MPEGIGYGEDSTEELIRLATDPMYNIADPSTIGALQQGVPQPGAMPPSMAFQEGPPIPMQQMEAEMQRMMQNAPQEILNIKIGIEQLLQAGELTTQELNMAVQLATAAAQNPQLYPQLRQFAIQQGLGDEEDIPPEYDQGLVFSIILAGKALQMQGGQPQGGQPMPQSDSQPPQATMRMGGEVPNSNNTDGSVAINAHKGEYVIPANVVLAKGTDFFDKMIGKDGTTKA